MAAGGTGAARSDGRRHLLSIDVDDLFVAVAEIHGSLPPAGYEPALERELAATLDVLDRCGRRATFFVNAQYCRRHPTLLGEITARGHPLASHGFQHRDVRTLSIAEFRDDVRRSLDVLSGHGGAILGYRAPGFTMPYEAERLSVLRDEGLRYVSTGVGVRRCNAPVSDVPIRLDGGLWHVPISVRRVAGTFEYPLGYGVAARLVPERLALALLRREAASGRYFHFYCHPFEIAGLDPAVAWRLRGRRAVAEARVYALRCGGRERLFQAIFDAFAFDSIEAALA
jgi:peptidoglycan/xylan/chitin deacetylase (PgdA/CDA1 family)